MVKVKTIRRKGPVTREQVRDWTQRLQRAVVRVGLPNSADQPKRYYSDDGVENVDAELTLVEVATFNEFGTRDGRVPSRPFMAISAETGRRALKHLVANGWVSVLRGRRRVEDLPDLLGLKHVSQIQRTISDGVDPANADATIYAKGSSKPLINTGQLRQSITYLVEGL